MLSVERTLKARE